MSKVDLLSPTLGGDSLCTQLKKKKITLINLAMLWVSGLSPHICGINNTYMKTQWSRPVSCIINIHKTFEVDNENLLSLSVRGYRSKMKCYQGHT